MKDKFFVGQRVRSARRGNNSHLPKGVHGAVIALDAQFGRLGYAVVFDGFSSNYHDASWFCVAADIEPIYDGDQKTAWSESTWAPIHLRKFAAPKEKHEQEKSTVKH